MKLLIRHFIDSAHMLEDGEELVTKQCANLHGHTYAIKVEIENQKLNTAGMVIDFKAVKLIIDRLDHRFINEVFKEYKIELQSTAENIAKVIAHWIVKEQKVNVIKVSVCEGYKGIERASWAIYEP